MFNFIKKSAILLASCSLSCAPLVNAAPTLWMQQKNDSRPLLVLDQKSQLVPKTIHEEKANYHLEVHYPQIEGTSLTKSTNRFNELVNSLINARINSFKNEISKSATEQPESPSFLKINYDLAGFVSRSQNTDYTSVRFDINSFEKGMAHPSLQTEVLNFDLGHNKQLSLADLFKPGSAYLEKISALSMKKLSGKQFPEDMIKAGASPKMENYKNWNLTLGGLLITFDEAQVAPRYQGKQEILIPNEALKDLYSPKTACTLGVINCDIT